MNEMKSRNKFLSETLGVSTWAAGVLWPALLRKKSKKKTGDRGVSLKRQMGRCFRIEITRPSPFPFWALQYASYVNLINALTNIFRVFEMRIGMNEFDHLIFIPT